MARDGQDVEAFPCSRIDDGTVLLDYGNLEPSRLLGQTRRTDT
jgi:hypothetical protein